MSREAFAYNYSEPSLSSNEPLFQTQMSEYIYINDNNNRVYGNNPIVFSSANISTKDALSAISLPDAKLIIPITTKVKITNGTFGTTGTAGHMKPTNALIMSYKSHAMFIDRVNVGLGSVNDIVGNSSNMLGLYVNETQKRRNINEAHIDNEIVSSYLDNHHSLNFHADVGEINNNLRSRSVFEDTFVNNAIIKRNMNRYSIMPADDTDLIVKSEMNTVPIISKDSKFSKKTTLNDYMYPFVTQNSTNDEITYYDYLTIPLSQCSDFFRAQNTPMAGLNNFSLKVYLSMGKATVTYKTETSGTAQGENKDSYFQLPPEKVEWSGSGICPYLISSISNDLKNAPLTGVPPTEPCVVLGTTKPVITVESSIGWNDTISNVGSGQQCRVVIPTYKIHPDISKKIFTDMRYKRVLYNDFVIDDTYQRISGFSASMKRIIIDVARVKRIYMIPFLSSESNGKADVPGKPKPWQSCLSSAPVTTSPLKISDVQIYQGSKSFFTAEFLSLSYAHYECLYYHLMNEYTGNTESSNYKSGLITKSMFQSGAYNSYCFDLVTASDDATFDEQNQIQIRWNNKGNPALFYDWIFILEMQKELTIDVVTCEAKK
jgi:hypothetical protein